MPAVTSRDKKGDGPFGPSPQDWRQNDDSGLSPAGLRALAALRCLRLCLL